MLMLFRFCGSTLLNSRTASHLRGIDISHFKSKRGKYRFQLLFSGGYCRRHLGASGQYLMRHEYAMRIDWLASSRVWLVVPVYQCYQSIAVEELAPAAGIVMVNRQNYCFHVVSV